LKSALIFVLRRARRQRLQRLLVLLRARLTMQSRNYLVTEALCQPSESPWHILYASREEGSFLATVSIDPDSFDFLLDKFRPGEGYL
jgi:hypothetical protein